MVIKTRKREITIPALTLTAVLILCIIGSAELYFYRSAKDRCTCVITGTVTNSGIRHIYNKYDPGETKCQTGRSWIHIDIQPNGEFKRGGIYANRYDHQKGDTVTIFYNPDDPDDYYVESYLEHIYKDTAIFCFAFGGIVFVIALLIFIIFNRKPRPEKQTDKKRQD